MKATVYVYTAQDAAVGGVVDPLFQESPRKEPAMVGIKISGDADDYDHVRWQVPEDYDGTIYDTLHGRWVEGPPPVRQYGLLIGEASLKELGIMPGEKNMLSRSKNFDVVELVEGMSPVAQ